MTDLKREDVARVLAENWDLSSRALRAPWPGQPFLTLNFIIDALQIRPEFESALKALEKEQGRG